MIKNIVILDKYKIEYPRFSDKLLCFIGYHTITIADKYINSENKTIDLTKKYKYEFCKIGGRDIAYCRVCGHEWIDKWNK